jgi:hypothetical protein
MNEPIVNFGLLGDRDGLRARLLYLPSNGCRKTSVYGLKAHLKAYFHFENQGETIECHMKSLSLIHQCKLVDK